jgi:hypothetical protein
MAENAPKNIDRRGFLRGAGGASAAAVALAAGAVGADPAEAYDPGAEEARGRYQPDSPDVQAFYRANGYESLKK